MKLAFIVYYLTFGGVERQITLLANEMARRGHDVYIISMVANKQCYEINPCIKRIHISDKGKGILKIYLRYLHLKYVLKGINPDITINFMFQSAYFCAFMPSKICGSVLYSERGDPGSSIYHGILNYIRKFALPRIDGFVFQLQGAIFLVKM